MDLFGATQDCWFGVKAQVFPVCFSFSLHEAVARVFEKK